MAHPMQLGMRVKGLGMRVQNYGMRVENYDGGQMGDVFSTLLTNLETSVSKGLTQAQNQAIASTLKTVASDPTVQQAVVASGNDAAIQSLAAQLKSAQQAAVANPWTTAALIGGLGLGAIFLFRAITK